MVAGSRRASSLVIPSHAMAQAAEATSGSAVAPFRKIKLISQEECDETREKSAVCRAHNLDPFGVGNGADVETGERPAEPVAVSGDGWAGGWSDGVVYDLRRRHVAKR